MRPDSLAFRLVAGAAIWSLLILAGGGYLLASGFRESVERSFDARLDVLLGGLIADAETSPDGMLELRQRFSQPRFERPFTGLYWQIADAATGEPLLQSNSLWDQRLSLPPPVQDGGIRRVTVEGPGQEGEVVRVVARDIRLPGAGTAFTFAVASSVAEVEQEIAGFSETIAVAVGVLMTGFIGALLIQVRYGLRPLRNVEEGLAAIRSGRSERLSGEFPAEIAPLAEEVNQLLSHNAQVVERARTHVGNLAHALKTPLSVLTNEATGSAAGTGAGGPALAEIVRRQTALMRRQVDHYLVRARTAATGGVLGARAPVAQVADDLVRTLKRIHRDRDYEVSVRVPDDLAFRGERQDLEELMGNLLDNAFKWADGRIEVAAEAQAGRVVICVDDDGPGLSEAERARVLKRGARLDESVPGSGLGLSIVSDIAGLYDGTFALEASPLGGVRARLSLPLAA